MQCMYPIRKSRSFWQIPLLCFHTCSEAYCSSTVQYYRVHDQLRIQISPNTDYSNGFCSKNGLMYNACVPLALYDISKPRGNLGDISYPDTVVILDPEFQIKISYPLDNPIMKQISTKHPITIREIIHIIKIIYQDIYEIEEQTAPVSTFHLIKPCENCKTGSGLTDMDSSLVETDRCSICYNDLQTEKIISKCRCSHLFHTGCITSWIDTGHGKSCPLCRQSFRHCVECDGLGAVNYEYTGVVVPPELRSIPQQRNRTRGIYGIHSIDFENLVLEGLVYNRVNKTLHLNICPA
jgi:hypothetical protein